ncbi:MAG: translation initiation factor IF-2 [Desulfocapsaceae bacterium]|nr:translation initiation factor IF-2 [Desulfocapsaceae bacterium]
MGRIRVYELAKETGISSKALATKLSDMGIEVKGPSSTVDEGAAARIRASVLKGGESEKSDGRGGAHASPGPTVIRRRPTIIRRRPQDEPEGSEPVADEVKKEGVPPESHVIQAEEKAAAGSGVETVQVPRVETPTVAEPAASDVQSDSAGAEATAEAAGPKETEVPAAEPARAKEWTERFKPVVKEAAGVKKVKKDSARKGLARVVGSIEMPVEEETKTQPPRPRKKGKPPEVRESAASVVPVVDDSLEEGARAKKKGKRDPVAGENDTEQEKGWKAGKLVKKGKKNVKFTHFNDEYQRGSGKRGKKGRGREKQIPQSTIEMKAIKKRIRVYDTITVGDLASRMKVKASEVIAKLMTLGVMATMNQAVDVETAMLIATDFGYEVEQGITEEIGILMLEEKEEGGDLKPRSPVVTVMGHVDHGKTSILDAIRKTDVALGEAGGITQHIGAYHVRSNAGDVTFIDTPGHAAFTEMRSRGAQVTDLVILVVAADDGVMDQTREAIHHAQAASVPILVAVNKIDKDNADPDRVKRELAEFGLNPEEWGGQTIYCQVSAKKNIGIDNLMENIQLMAEMLELKADSSRKAKGRVIEAQLDKGRGPVATVLVQEGTLRPGNFFVVGQFSGKVRAMLDDKGRPIKEAGPSIPVEVQGLSGVPSAGDEFVVVTDEKMARNVSYSRSLKIRETELGASSKISLDKLFEKMSQGDVKELRVVLRADVQGTLEAFAKAAEELSTDQIKVRVLHEGTGTITESDILLASASEAIIIGFNVRPAAKVKDLAVKENVDVRAYDVIYNALDDIRKAMVGMLDPTFREDVIGNADVRETFHVPKIGTIAGCSVAEGKIQRNASVRVVRDGVVIYTGKIHSLRRFKDDVKEVAAGYECGIGVENFNDIKVGDSLEAFVMLQVEATLTGDKK